MDSYHLISKNFDKYSNLRKSRRPLPEGQSESYSCTRGVDINRNYDIEFESMADGLERSNPCSEVYKGLYAFSEPETRAIKGLVESEITIKSAMNFHCYGNLWVKPTNYIEKGDKDPLEDMPEKKFYTFFKDFAPFPRKAIVTNAVDAVDYPAPGEASDWMFFKHKIFAWSPELGVNKVDSPEGNPD